MGGVAVRGRGEDVRDGGRLRADEVGRGKVRGPRVDGHLHIGVDGQRGGGGGRVGEAVRLPGDERDVVLADDHVPRVGRSGRYVGAEPAVRDGGGGVGGPPPGCGAGGEVAVGDLLRGRVGVLGGGTGRGEDTAEQCGEG